MKPFDLELAIAGHPLITRNGDEILEFHYFKSSNSDYPIFCNIDNTNGISSFTEEGNFNQSFINHKNDLFLDDSIPWNKPLMTGDIIEIKINVGDNKHQWEKRRLIKVLGGNNDGDCYYTNEANYQKYLNNERYDQNFIKRGKWRIAIVQKIDITIDVNGNKIDISSLSKDLLLSIQKEIDVIVNK